MKKIILCFYRYLPCFLHVNDEDSEDIQLIGIDWYVDNIIMFLIWLDINVFKVKNLSLKITNIEHEL